MFGKQTARLAASRALAVLVAACLAVAGLPFAAFADEESGTQTAEGELSCGNGWVLAYTATCEDGSTWEASITGPTDSSAGSGQLSIPASIALDDGSTATVTELGASAFSGCEELTAVELPDTLVIIGKDAFRQSNLASISIPASVAYIPVRCFWKCETLASIEFEGEVLDHLGYAAFQGCTALQEIYVPALRGSEYYSVRYTASSTTTGEFRLGVKCFYGCTSLALIVFLAGGEGTYTSDGGSTYSSTAADLIIVNYTTNSSVRGFEELGNATYYAMKFYASEEDYEADEYGTQAAYTAVYPSGANLLTALYSPESITGSLYASEGTMPELADGMAWGVSGGALAGSSATLSNVAEVYPIDCYNLDYGWVSSDEIVNSSGLNYNDAATNEQMVRLDSSGIPDLSDITVYAADGSVVDESYYELIFLNVVTSGGMGEEVRTYTQVYAGEAWEAGTYQVYADGLDGTPCEGTSTGTASDDSPTGKSGASFAVGYYTANVVTYTGTERSSLLGTIGLAANENINGTPAFVAVACADSWQNCLIAVGLAAVGGGQAVFVEGVDEDGEDLTADRVYSVVSGSGASKVYVVGEISDAATERLETVMLVKNGSVSAFPYDDAEDAAALSLSVYENLQRIADANGYAWGTTAVVASSTQQLASSAIAAYAYADGCPVILCEEDGTLSEEALADLAGTDDYGNALFERVVVAGPQEYVPEATLEAIEALGLEVERVADEESAYESSVEVGEAIDADFGGTNGRSLMVASASDATNVYVAAQFAHNNGSELVLAYSSADAKAILERAYEETGGAMNAVYLVGDFTDVEAALGTAGSSDLYSLFTTLWADVADTGVAVGDTIEQDGVLYEVSSATGAAYVKLAEPSLEVLAWGDLAYDGTTYETGSVADAQFAGCTSLRNVTVDAAGIGSSAFAGCTSLVNVYADVASIGSSAFAGCTALANAITSAAGIGASAFAGCTALTSVSLMSASLKTLPPSLFSGCSKLAIVNIASTALTGVGSKAFYGCKKLKSISLKSTKLTSIGASAFAGCSQLATASIASTALASVGGKAFYGCKKLKSLNLKSKKLKSIGVSAFQGCSALTGVSIASTALTSLGSKAFCNCKKLGSISLKSTKLTSIGASAFAGCSQLATASIASTALASVGGKAFYGCKKLKSLNLKSKKLKSIGASAFQGCSAMTKLSFSSTALTKIGAKALYGCKKLKTLTIKTKKLKTVGKNALKGTTKKLTVKVPKAKVKKYKKLLRKRGLKKKAKVKAA